MRFGKWNSAIVRYADQVATPSVINHFVLEVARTAVEGGLSLKIKLSPEKMIFHERHHTSSTFPALSTRALAASDGF